MTGWQVYWLFQLDSIRVLFFVLSIISLAAFLVISFIAQICAGVSKDYMELSSSKKEVAMAAKFVNKTPWIIGGILFFISITAFLPDTKTMAAIYILPKIASSENIEMVGKDGSDIYKLGIQRLKDILEEPKQTK